MEKALLKLKYADEPSEYTIIKTFNDVEEYIEELKFTTVVDGVKLEREGGTKYFSAVHRLQDMYNALYAKLVEGSNVAVNSIPVDSIISHKALLMHKMISDGKIIYVNSKGGMMPHNDNMEVIKTWNE